jgi:hypothetical protein
MTQSARGRVVLRFIIEPSGKVTKTVLKHTDFTIKSLNYCMEKVPSRLKFPEFEGAPVAVTATLHMGVY